MKKVVFKLEVNGDRELKKVMKTVSGLSGVDSISMTRKEQNLTVIGYFDPVTIVKKLRKLNGWVEIISVGPAKVLEEKKKEEPKQDDRTC